MSVRKPCQMGGVTGDKQLLFNRKLSRDSHFLFQNLKFPVALFASQELQGKAPGMRRESLTKTARGAAEHRKK